MRKATLAAGALALCGILFSALPAGAGLVPSSYRPKIVLHVRGTTIKNQCSTAFTPTTCSEVVTAAASGTSGTPLYYYIYLVAVKGDSMESIAGVQCGLWYQNGASYLTSPEADQTGLDIFSWTLCAQMEFIYGTGPNWLQPGGSNLITWNAESTDAIKGCQTDEFAVAGYWYVGSYGPDVFGVIRRPVDGAGKVASCDAEEVIIQNGEYGKVTFSVGGATPGCNPCTEYCAIIPVVVTTWGSVKSMYSR